MEAQDIRYGQTVIHVPSGKEYKIIGYAAYADENGRQLVVCRSAHGIAYPKYIKNLQVKP